MQTVDKTRRERLQMLIAQYGSIAALNVALGLDRTDATLSQIRTRAAHSRTGKPRVMGDDLARRIETTLDKPEGWMDTPPGMEFASDGPRLQALHHVAEALAPFQIDQWIAIGKTLAEHPDTSALGKIPERAAGQTLREIKEPAPAPAQTGRSGSSSGAGLSLTKPAAAKKGGLFDPALKKPQRGAVDVGEQNKRSDRKGHGRGR